jgi:hypothetical protein
MRDTWQSSVFQEAILPQGARELVLSGFGTGG